MTTNGSDEDRPDRSETAEPAHPDEADAACAPIAPGALNESPSGKARKRVSAGLIVAGAILLALSVPALWLNSIVASTDAWVDAMAPLAADPAVQSQIASIASDAVLDNLEIGRVAEEQLPDDLDFLAVPIASFMESLVREEALNLVQSPAFYKLWETMNTAAHQGFTALVNGGERGMLNSADGVISLDVDAVVEAVGERLASKGFSFADGIAFDRDARVVLVESSALESLQTLLVVLPTVAFALLVSGLALLTYGMVVSLERRRAAQRAAAALAASLLAVWAAFHIAEAPLEHAIAPLGGGLGTAFGAAFGIVLSPLFGLLGGLAVLTALAWLVLFLTGPAWPARFVRTRISMLVDRARAAAKSLEAAATR